METAITKFAPHRQAGKKDQKPWMSRELKSMHLKEKRLFSRKKKRRTRNSNDQLKDLQRAIQKKSRQEYWRYVENIMMPSATPSGNTVEEESQNNINNRKEAPDRKRLYQYIKHCKQDSVGVAPIRDTKTGKLETEGKRRHSS